MAGGIRLGPNRDRSFSGECFQQISCLNLVGLLFRIPLDDGHYPCLIFQLRIKRLNSKNQQKIIFPSKNQFPLMLILLGEMIAF